MNSILEYIGEAMSSSVAKLVRLGATVAGPSGVWVKAKLNPDNFIYLRTCTLWAYTNGHVCAPQSMWCSDT